MSQYTAMSREQAVADQVPERLLEELDPLRARLDPGIHPTLDQREHENRDQHGDDEKGNLFHGRVPVGGGADEQTALLAFSTSGGALSEVVASLTEGDRVELEWLQIKIEMDTDIEEHKFGMVEQCEKLLKLDAATEEALVKQYPQPELLLPKVAPKAKGEEKAALEAKFGKKKKRKGKKGRA